MEACRPRPRDRHGAWRQCHAPLADDEPNVKALLKAEGFASRPSVASRPGGSGIKLRIWGSGVRISSGAPKAQKKSGHLHIIEIRHAEGENLHGICMAKSGVCLSRHERPSAGRAERTSDAGRLCDYASGC